MINLLTTIQIVAILQGVFLSTILIQKKEEYKKPVFWIFLGCIISVILFAIGDDDYNLLVSDSNWFFFHESLIITFFFLFIRYSNSDQNEFNKTDFLFFLPYLLAIALEVLLDVAYFEDNTFLRVSSRLVELSFIGMLLYSIYDIFKNKKEKWLLAFLVPLTIIYSIDEISPLLPPFDVSFLSLDSYGIFLITIFLFYFVIYKLIVSPKEVLPKSADNKYKLSNLSKSEVESIKKELNRLMTEEKLFKNQKINANEVAQKIGITRQQLSEVLNVHVGTRFQDYVNQHRVGEFINCLHQEEYKKFTLLGIATEVGFSSKSSFNSTFKKIKGMTPSEYKKRENIG